MSTESVNSNTRAGVWLKPAQIHDLRTAAQSDQFLGYLRDRNEVIVALMYDTGLRVAELVALNVDMIDFEEGTIYLPTELQKDYPNDRTPPPRTMSLAEDEATRDTVRLLKSYINNRWKDSEAVFPSRQADRMTTESVRRAITSLAETANVEPYLIDAGRGEPTAVTPHAIRHSVAYRMLHVEDGYSIYDVRNRLRHSSVQTTERTYDHFDKI